MEKAVYKIYLEFYIVAIIVLGLEMLFLRETVGDEVGGISLIFNGFELFLLMLIQIVTLLLVLPLHRFCKKHRMIVGKRIFFQLNMRRVHYFVFFLLIIQIFCTVITGNGVTKADVVNSNNNSVLAMLCNLLKVQSFFPIYYICAREKRRLYVVNIVLYAVWQLICGWSSFIVLIAFWELYCLFKERKIKKSIMVLFERFSLLIVIFMYGAGALLYKFIWPLKNTIRYGFSFGKITVVDGLTRLVSRLTNFPQSLIAVQNSERISYLYNNQSVWNPDVLSLFKSLVPSFIMPNKEFRPISNLVKQSIWYDIVPGTGTGLNFFSVGYNIFKADFMEGFVWIGIFLILFWVTLELVVMFDNGTNSTNILIFLFIFQVLYSGSMETCFSYGYLGMVYLLPIMIIFGVVRIKRSL